MDRINTILVEDHEITRLGLRKMLEHIAAVNLIGEAANGRDAVDKILELRPELVLMDIGLPEVDGIEATKLIKGALAVKVIMITSHDRDEDVFAGLAAGADAYCMKGISSVQLDTAIQSVIQGGVYLDPGIARQIIKASSSTRANVDSQVKATSNIFHLSEREMEVLQLLVDGLTNQQMADRLYLSAETIKTHMRHLMEKLSVSDRTQAAVKAVREGLVLNKCNEKS